ncbi:Polyprotein [Phytophthora palmivora]|uniref:Polyprotein n=1 Tax=Phytophthora palmivora TaxID=4796 RepID=A0A2P4XDX2_9STRA|nr:Polyprotein [Phytophthora palmivora]
MGRGYSYDCHICHPGHKALAEQSNVAQGNNQGFGEDFDEDYTPRAWFESLLLVLAVAAIYELSYPSDGCTYCVPERHHGSGQKMYMRQPHGFATRCSERLVCELQETCTA